MNEEFQKDLKQMQRAVENCGIYCPFQPSRFFMSNIDAKEKALQVLGLFEENIGNCHCLVDIDKYIKKWSEK